MNYGYLTASQDLQQAHFYIISNSIYIPQLSSSFLINLTSNTISSGIECAQQCLQYEMCQTATYYEGIQTCSLYNEKSDIGQILSVVNQASYVLAMEIREPIGEQSLRLTLASLF
jgi:hypothetical protein